jgi:hypothetical protein
VDGYPSEDAPDVNPGEMTQAQRIEAMNRLGAGANPNVRWRYQLLPECTVEVMARRAGRRSLVLRLSLLDASIGLDFDKGNSTHEVRVRPQQGLNQQDVSVLDSPRWTDAVVMQSLLNHVQQGCSEVDPAPGQHLTPAMRLPDGARGTSHVVG